MPKQTGDVHSVALEFLRTGTSHNQTLSPDVSYIALCGSRPQAEFRVNIEQQKFEQYLNLLRYASKDAAALQIGKDELQERVTGVFNTIPALRDESNTGAGWLHLRLVMEPKELGMLPFELALTPDGLQAAGEQPFLLNPQRLTTLTREIRQVASRAYTWPGRPRVLFAWAAPQAQVPHDQHWERLLDALEPWAKPMTGNAEPVPDYAKLVTEVGQASLEALKAEFASQPYTHVHILAHGTEVVRSGGANFALALHDAKGGVDAVDGPRLAGALSAVGGNGTRHPAVVTVAACDSGNAGSVIRPGASLAHALHGSGVPLVLTSQFPLSQKGSVRLVSTLYPRLFCGEDPRKALYHVRRELTEVTVEGVPEVHDWASLVAYARFPDDLDDQLAGGGLAVELEFMRTANAWVDHVLEHGEKIGPTFEAVATRLMRSIAKLEELLKPDSPDPRRAENLGLLGSAYKRQAEHLYRMGDASPVVRNRLRKESHQALEKARSWYRKGADLLSHWAATQFLSLTAVTTGTLEAYADLWTVTQFLANRDLSNSGQRIWALGTMAELYLLRPFTVPADRFDAERTSAVAKVREYLRELSASEPAFPKESTARQLERYMTWWADAFPTAASGRLKQMAADLRDCLPPLEECRA